MRIQLFEQATTRDLLSNYKTLKRSLRLEKSSCFLYCEHCGAELFGEWITAIHPDWGNIDSDIVDTVSSLPNTSDLFDSAKEGALAFCSLEKCPICGATLEYKKGYFAYTKLEDLFENQFIKALLHEADVEKKEPERLEIEDSELEDFQFDFGDDDYVKQNVDHAYRNQFLPYFATYEKHTLSMRARPGFSTLYLVHLPGLNVDSKDDMDACARLTSGLDAATVDDTFSLLRFRRLTDMALGRNEARLFVNTCAAAETSVAAHTKAESIKGNPSLLREYIQHLFQTETDLQALSQYLPQLYMHRHVIGRKAARDKGLPQYQHNMQCMHIQKQIDALKKNIQSLTAQSVNVAISDNDLPINKPVPPTAPSEPIYKKPGLFNKKATEAHNDMLKQQFSVKMQEYHMALDVYEAETLNYEKARQEAYNAKLAEAKQVQDLQIATENEKLDKLLHEQHALLTKGSSISFSPSSAILLKECLDNEILDIESLVQKLFEAKKALYACDIILEKYRSFSPISHFYDYLESGRCETLEGASGAYNLYENECRDNRMAAQLDKVIQSLDTIKDSQRMLYKQLQVANQQMARMQTSLDKAVNTLTDMSASLNSIANNTALIAHNTERTAYYAKINSSLLNSIGFMMALS